MIELTPAQAGRALGGEPLAASVRGISIDTRSLRAGDMFVALRGERFDGHEFVGAALAAGASALVVCREAATQVGAEAAAYGAAVYEVDDTLQALWGLAREVRRSSTATVFAITGSVGKTSTKDALAAMVGRARRVVATAANQNNEIGVALTLLSIEPDTEAVVVEMGMRGLGQIAQLAEVAEPDVGVITNVHPVHLELLGSMEHIAQAKAELVGRLRSDGVAVVPAGCDLLEPYVAAHAGLVVRFSTDPHAADAEVVGAIEQGAGGAERYLRVRWPEGEVSVETTNMWSHAVTNAVAAAAACYAAGLPMEACVAGINDLRLSAGRGQIISLAGLWVIDDTYNANPAAVRAALDNLVSLAGEKGGRAVAVLGDMLELGPRSGSFHREIGEYACERGVRRLWGVGRQSLATVEGFRERCREAGSAKEGCEAGHVGSAEECAPVLSSLEPGDVVLFKASRSMGLETMVRRVVDQGGTTKKETE
jgi:UDP-N-acetylmuramoyl-tripeptide--D-alanyl-D-alanine ligase